MKEQDRFIHWRAIVLRWAAELLRGYGYPNVAGSVERVAAEIKGKPLDGGGFYFARPTETGDGYELGAWKRQVLDRRGYTDNPPNALAFVLPLVEAEPGTTTATTLDMYLGDY